LDFWKLEVDMKKLGSLTVILGILLLTISAFISNPAPSMDATPWPEETKAVTSIDDGFAGNWIAYSVIPLKVGASSGIKPGLRMRITPESYSVGDASCPDPNYSIKTVSKTEFLQGNSSSIEWEDFYGDQFPYLSTGCTGVQPANYALASYHALSALVDDTLIFFEPDNSVTTNGMEVVSDLISESSKKPLYEMHGQVPVIQDPSAEKLNALVMKAVTDELDGFKKNFKDWEIPPEMANAVSFMWISYDVPLLTPQMVGIRLHVDYYMAGAAHPNHYFKVINYDLEKGKTGTIKDLFKDTPKALTVLSEYCKTDLSKPDFPLFEEGLETKEVNFANWNLTEKGLRLSFDPYQVAPYAAGAQEVVVPFRVLKSLANTATGFGAYIAQK
jgi:hypothetical protein